MFEMSERSVCGIEWSTAVVSVAPIYAPNMVMMMFLWVGFFSFRFTISQLCIFMHLEYTWSSSFFWWHFFLDKKGKLQLKFYFLGEKNAKKNKSNIFFVGTLLFL